MIYGFNGWMDGWMDVIRGNAIWSTYCRCLNMKPFAYPRLGLPPHPSDPSIASGRQVSMSCVYPRRGQQCYYSLQKSFVQLTTIFTLNRSLRSLFLHYRAYTILVYNSFTFISSYYFINHFKVYFCKYFTMVYFNSDEDEEAVAAALTFSTQVSSCFDYDNEEKTDDLEVQTMQSRVEAMIPTWALTKPQGANR